LIAATEFERADDSESVAIGRVRATLEVPVEDMLNLFR